MIIYFAGVNQIHFCESFAGRTVLETFTDSRPLYGRYRALFASMALDCGAYSELTTGVPVDIHEYADFVDEHGAFYDWVASVDSIRGGVAANLANWQFLLDRGIEAMPTYHQGEPLSVLLDYCSRSPRVGLGFQRPIDNAEAFLDDAFAVIPASVKVHGWAMTNYTGAYPFASVDSTSWLHELKALRVASTTQQSRAFGHLTDRELIEIVQKRYDRLPKNLRWGGRRTGRQLGLLPEAA